MNFALFNPQGPVAAAQSDLIKTALVLMLAVIVPTLILFFIFARRYRATNMQAKRVSEADQQRPHSAWRGLVLWAIPVVVVAVLGVISWNAAFALDPYKPIPATSGATVAPGIRPLTIQVVALPWKWLFIYPAQNIATVNFVEFPVGTPVHFELTADGPISAFWIPQLGSQIYAMAAMETQLNLRADAPGEFAGKDNEINGAGYAGMTFTAKASSQQDFDWWVAAVKARSLNSIFVNDTLTAEAYNALAAPSENNPVAFYSAVESGLFNNVMMKFMAPAHRQGMQMQ